MSRLLAKHVCSGVHDAHVSFCQAVYKVKTCTVRISLHKPLLNMGYYQILKVVGRAKSNAELVYEKFRQSQVFMIFEPWKGRGGGGAFSLKLQCSRAWFKEIATGLKIVDACRSLHHPTTSLSSKLARARIFLLMNIAAKACCASKVRSSWSFGGASMQF